MLHKQRDKIAAKRLLQPNFATIAVIVDVSGLSASWIGERRMTGYAALVGGTATCSATVVGPGGPSESTSR